MHLFPINQGRFHEAIYSGVEMRTFPICLGLWKPIWQREVWPSCSASELTAPFILPPTPQKSLGQRLESGTLLGEEKRRGRGEGRAESDADGFICIADPFLSRVAGAHAVCVAGNTIVPHCVFSRTLEGSIPTAPRGRGSLAVIPQLQKGDSGEKR